MSDMTRLLRQTIYSVGASIICHTIANCVDAITFDMVKLHNSSIDCWSALYGNVYNLTEYGPTHNKGGGPSRVWSLGGNDGTAIFDAVHGDDKQWLTQFGTIQNLGGLETPTSPPSHSPTTPPSPSPEAFPTTLHPTHILDTAEPSKTDPDLILPEELATHNTTTDCWVAFYEKVYNMTDYADLHPSPGAPVIHQQCGENGTQAFARFHPQRYLNVVSDFFLGELIVGEDLPPPTPSPVTSPTSDTSLPTHILDTAQPSETHPDLILPEELATHNTTTDCWVAFYEHVYNMTDYADLHPGPGAPVIHQQCGENGTQAFALFHPQRYLNVVSTYIVGEWSPPPPTPGPSPGDTHISLLELKTHDNSQDCWVVYYDTVYDMTDFANLHPGPGAAAIHPFCGWIGTEEYDIYHDKSLLVTVESYVVVYLGVSSAPEAVITLALTISIFGAIAILYYL